MLIIIMGESLKITTPSEMNTNTYELTIFRYTTIFSCVTYFPSQLCCIQLQLMLIYHAFHLTMTVNDLPMMIPHVQGFNRKVHLSSPESQFLENNLVLEHPFD